MYFTNSEYSPSFNVDSDTYFANTLTALSSHAQSIGNSAPTNLSTHTVYYNLDVDYQTTAGNYTGTITYTAIGDF